MKYNINMKYLWRKTMKAFISFLMSAIAFISSFLGIAQKEPVLPAETDGFVPVVRFTACSDTHVTDYYEESDRAGRITKLFEVAYDFAQNDPYYNKLDAAMFVGDCTDNGTDKQFETLGEEIAAGKREGTQLLAIAADHHDGYIGPSSLDSISDISGLDSDFHAVINGFHFIGLSASKNEYDAYAPYQRRWLKEQLKAAAADDPEKPIFVCHHEHVLSTVYGSDPLDTWGIAYFNDILNKYPQIVHFSGHSHYPLNDPRSVVQGNFTTVGTGSMSYAEFRYKEKIKIRPSDNGRCAQFWIVEADAGNNVRLTGIDLNSADILCQYVLPAVCEKSEYVFTEKNQKLLSSAPAFGDGAVLEIADNHDGTYTVTAPKAVATDGKIVFAYRIRVFGTTGIQTHTEYLVNDYYLSNPYESVSFTVKARTGFRVEVTAENAYYMSSDPLVGYIG